MIMITVVQQLYGCTYRVQGTTGWTSSTVAQYYNPNNNPRILPLITNLPIPPSFTAKRGARENANDHLQLCGETQCSSRSNTKKRTKERLMQSETSRDCLKLLNTHCGAYSFQDGAV